jgi:hypothetical protein
LVVLIIGAVVGAILYFNKKTANNNSSSSNAVSSATLKQQNNETAMFNDLNAKKIDVSSLQFNNSTGATIARLNTTNVALSAGDIEHAWTTIYTLYTNYPTVTSFDAYVMSGSTKLIDIQTTRTNLDTTISGIDKTKLAQADSTTLSTVLLSLKVTTTADVAGLLK